MNHTTKCEINQKFGELILFAKTEQESKKLTKEQEAHYLVCDHPICKGIMANLKKHGLFQMNEEKQNEYDQEQKRLGGMEN